MNIYFGGNIIVRIDKLMPFLLKLYNAGKVNRHRRSVLVLGPPGEPT